VPFVVNQIGRIYDIIPRGVFEAFISDRALAGTLQVIHKLEAGMLMLHDVSMGRVRIKIEIFKFYKGVFFHKFTHKNKKYIWPLF
jgi:hypothetical protein